MSWAYGDDFVGRAEDGFAAARAQSAANQAKTEVERLRADVERLLLISEALWTFLKEQHGYTDEQLVQRIEQIDLRDGKLDGKVAKQPQPVCPDCGRVIQRKRNRCQYCGTLIAIDPFER